MPEALRLSLFPDPVHRPLAALVLVENLSEEGEKRVGFGEDPFTGVCAGSVGGKEGVGKEACEHPPQLMERSPAQSGEVFFVNLLLASAFS